MDKKGRSLFLLGIIIFFVVLAGVVYFVFFDKDIGEKVILKNPSDGLSFEEAVSQFDENFVIYLLYSIGAQNLHNPPLSSDAPKIELYVGDDIYNSEVVKGVIKVGGGKIDSEDIIIRTSAEEAVKMVQNKNYIFDSFNSGSSTIELVSSKTTLFAKGYLEIYNDLT